MNTLLSRKQEVAPVAGIQVGKLFVSVALQQSDGTIVTCVLGRYM